MLGRVGNDRGDGKDASGGGQRNGGGLLKDLFELVDDHDGGGAAVM